MPESVVFICIIRILVVILRTKIMGGMIPAKLSCAMFELYKKEISGFFSSATGVLVIGIFLLLTSVVLWLLPGEQNVLDMGYAGLDGLFQMAPWLYLFLIPALTMRLFSDEYRSGTMEWLCSKPLQKWKIVAAKYLAGWTVACMSLLPTLLYLLTIYKLGVPAGNLDWGGFWGSFVGLLLLAAVYTAIGVFASSLSANAVVAFLLAALLCLGVYSGFDALGSLFQEAEWQECFSQCGLNAHYEAMSRGVLDTFDLVYCVSVSLLFLLLTVVHIQAKALRLLWLAVPIFVLMNILAARAFVRFDLTSEKRYTLSNNTKKLLADAKRPVEVTVYLDGSLNRGFLHLREAVRTTLTDMSAYAQSGFVYRFVDPSEAPNEQTRQQQYAALVARGMKPTMVYERDNEGKSAQKIIFPWAECVSGKDTVQVALLQNVSGYTAEENLNHSIETLEYGFSDALRILLQNNDQRIVFLEGHGEWGDMALADAMKKLSRYYSIDRGALSTDVHALDPYKVVVVAGPVEKFSESDKYIIDQYIMKGGRVLWLLDGVRTDKRYVSVVNELNLDDQLFTYGMRVEPVVLLDAQCAMMPINTAAAGEEPQFEPTPWYYAPLLLPSAASVITKHLPLTRSDFASVVSFVGEDESATLRKSVLLASSNRAGVEKVPAPVSMDVVEMSPDDPFFAYSYLPVAVLLEGVFPSVFAHRMTPQELPASRVVEQSSPTRMILVADGDVIRNDVQGSGEAAEPLPLGYDSYSNQQFGNDDFILNAVNYLADDEDWMSLRGREWKIRLLDRQAINAHRVAIQAVNVALPLLLLLLLSGLFWWLRQKRYTA